MSSLAGRFDVAMGAGLVQDATHHDPDRSDSHLVFSAENRLLRDHLALSDAATERPPGTPQVERDGGDVQLNMEYGAPVSAAGRAQGLALEVQAGRLVVLGEAGFLRAQRGRNGDAARRR